MKKLFFAAAIIMLAASCGSKEESEDKEGGKKEKAAKTSKERIEELDKEFRTATKLEEKKAKEFVGLCLEYADAHPDDEKSPVYLENGALVAGAMGKYSLKTKMFQFILDKHKDYANYNNVLYLQAVCWDTEMKNKDQAKKFYVMTVEQHKDSGVIESAQARLATIDSLTFEQHEQMLINKMKQQLNK